MGVYIDRTSRQYDRFVGICNGCGKEKLKESMVTVMTKRKYTNPKTIAHFCEDCFISFCERYEICE